MTMDPRLLAALDATLDAEPHLTADAIVDAITTAAPSGQSRNLLDAYVQSHPDGLVSGASDAPMVVGRVVDALRALGATAVQRPRCQDCGLERKLPYVAERGRRCTACFNRSNAEQCSRCGKKRPVEARDGASPVCGLCRRADPANHETCSQCHQLGPVVVRPLSGPVCPRCYQLPKKRCDVCGEQAQIHSRRGGGAVCDRCYRSPPGRCRECGETAMLTVAASAERDGVCASCYRQPSVECASCGRMRPCNVRSEQGPLCWTCGPRPAHPCRRCGRVLPAQLNDAEGPLCSGCYDHVHRQPCGRCGEECRPYESGTCARCVLHERLLDALDLRARPRPELEPLLDALASVDQPRSVLLWLQRSEGAVILAQLAAGEIELSHDGLDTLGRSKPADHVRGLLIASGLVPDIEIHVERLGPWLEELLVGAAPAHAKLVRPFATWHLFRRVRFRADHGRFTENGAKWARLRVRQALVFLEWLDQHGVQLEDLTQSHVDLWLAGGPTTRYVINDFLRWAGNRRLVHGVEVPQRHALSPVVALDDDERWDQVERLLQGNRIDLGVRVAGLLAVLFGQHLSRIVRLRRSAVTRDDQQVSVRLGADDLVLPPRLDVLMSELTNRRGHAAVSTDAWLFAGGTPGRPITAEQMRNRLAELGIVLRPSRQAALLQIASELPAPVLADLLGLHPNTAVEWVRVAQADWSAYAASGPTGGRRAGDVGGSPERRPAAPHGGFAES